MSKAGKKESRENSDMEDKERIIIHVDMDAFFAAIEQLDHPEYRGKPVVVGADPEGGRGRGVVSTCSYEARKYGIHSAQPIGEAYRRCPNAVFLPVRMERYSGMSARIRAIFREFTPLVEPISIDEAFLDVTDTVHLFGGKYATAERLQETIRSRTDLTASLGIAPNKMLAKIASDLDKPRGRVIVEPGKIRQFLDPLPAGRLWGVGEKTEKILGDMGIKTVGNLARCDEKVLIERLGKHGRNLLALARGHDDRPVKTNDEVKSVGHEHTFREDTNDADLLAGKLMQLSERVASRLRSGGHSGRTVMTKVRLGNFTTYTRTITLDKPTTLAHEIFDAALHNFKRVDLKGQKVRLIGVSVSGLDRPRARQTQLFSSAPDSDDTDEKWQRLSKAIDEIEARFGGGAIRRGTSIYMESAKDR
jgi:nucleotidyltransferase/DNA polymerase involved in DNA repair